MIDEAQRIITTIRQMDASLDDSKSRRDYDSEDDDLQVTFPLTRCLQVLKEKHMQISRLHRERFEQVKSKDSPPTSLEMNVVANASQQIRASRSTGVVLVTPGTHVCEVSTSADRTKPVNSHQF